MKNKILSILSMRHSSAMSIPLIIFLVLLSTGLFAKMNIVTTLPDYASIANEIGGNKVNAVSLIKGSQDPHFVDGKPSFLIKMNKADLLILTGLGLESGWLPKLITNSRNSKITIGSEGYLDASRYVKLIDANKAVDRSMGDVHPGGNPHFYTSPVELFKISEEIHNRLVQLDSKNKDYYNKKWEIFKKKYLAKLTEWQSKLSKFKGMRVVEYHESWIYFLNWAGLRLSGSLEPKPGISPSAKHVMQLLRDVKNKHIKYMIQEIYYPTRLSKLFAKKSGSKLLVLPSSVRAFEGIDNIWEKFDYVVDNLTK